MIRMSVEFDEKTHKQLGELAVAFNRSKIGHLRELIKEDYEELQRRTV